jgi:hypothetical protein
MRRDATADYEVMLCQLGNDSMKFDDATWKRWTVWIGSIKDDLSQTINDRALFRTFGTVWEQNAAWITEHHGDRFCRFVVRGHVARTALGIRRHSKTKESISLAHLLEQIRKCAPQITFQFYETRYPRDAGGMDWQTAAFRLLSTDGDTVSAEVVGRDLETLRQSADASEKFADKVIAHLDSNGFKDKLTFGSMHGAVDRLDKLTCRYLRFLGGSGYDTLEAHPQYPWDRIFTVPLKRPP